MNKIYGYWISPKDDVLEVPYESHAEVALTYVLKRKPRKYTVYAVMFRLGYMRVVNDGHGVEYWSRHKLTKLQKEFMQDASYVDLADNSTAYSFLYKGLIP